MQVIAQSGDDRFIVLDDGKYRVLDLDRGYLWSAAPLQSLLARGYWTDPDPATDVEELRARVLDVELVTGEALRDPHDNPRLPE